MNIVCIGAGNVGWHLASHLAEADFTISQVVSRTMDHAHKLGQLVNAPYTTSMSEVLPGADIYLYAVPDNQLSSVIAQNPIKTGIHCHTAGSLSMDLFSGHVENYGVFYPLQTFSKQKQVDFHDIPILIEANNKHNLHLLQKMASHLSNKILLTTFQQRQQLHLAAVFACNFSNNLFTIADQLLKGANLPFDLLLPLIRETVEKAAILTPETAQTGPAARKDTDIIEMHLTMLENDKQLQTLYRLLTDNILKNKAIVSK